jgi:predicted RNA binding protein YcfA (HicA-like mRNA interferase family)
MPKIAPVSWKVLVRIFELEGFAYVRERGDHLVYTKLGVARPLVIPKYDEIPVFIIKNNIRSAKMTRERYLELLEVAKTSG